jgi:hypothetical protein
MGQHLSRATWRRKTAVAKFEQDWQGGVWPVQVLLPQVGARWCINCFPDGGVNAWSGPQACQVPW